MEIRMIRPDEAEKLVQVRLDFFKIFYPDWADKATAGEKTQMAARLGSYYREHLGQSLEAAAAFEADKIVSAATLNIIQKAPMPSAPYGRVGEIINVLTYPEYGRRGLAKRVLQLLLQKAADMNLDRIDLLASNEGKGLYAKLGFTALADHLPMRLDLERMA